MSERGTVFWNDETQSWDDGTEPAPYAPPPPPRPVHVPGTADGLPEGPSFDGDQWPEPAPGPGGTRPAEPAESAERAPGTGRGPNTAVVAAIAVVLVVGFGIRLAWVSGDDTSSVARGSESAPTGSATPTWPPSPTSPTSPTWPPSPTPAPSDAFPGFRVTMEDEFRIVVPASWERRVEDGLDGASVHYYVDPADSLRFVQVFPVTEEDMTPMKALKLAEKDLESRRNDYRRNTLSAVADHRGSAAELDYSFRSQESGTQVRVLDRVFHGDDDTLYAVLTAAPDDAWPEQRAIHAQAVSGFALTGISSSP